MKRLLFVCVENACRSQMAEGFARALGAGEIEVWSAGSRPSGQVNARALASMSEAGIDISKHQSKGLEALPDGAWDCVVTMGCGDACPNLTARRREDWAIPDPKTMEPEAFGAVRDLIRLGVERLLDDLRE